jgi:hypothetical protein
VQGDSTSSAGDSTSSRARSSRVELGHSTSSDSSECSLASAVELVQGTRRARRRVELVDCSAVESSLVTRRRVESLDVESSAVWLGCSTSSAVQGTRRRARRVESSRSRSLQRVQSLESGHSTSSRARSSRVEQGDCSAGDSTSSRVTRRRARAVWLGCSSLVTRRRVESGHSSECSRVQSGECSHSTSSRVQSS